MAVTLVEAEKFTTNKVKKGVLKEIHRESIVLKKLPFIDVVGNAYQYLRENTLPDASFFNPNEVWTEDVPTYTQKTATIKIMGGDADVDNFLKATRSNHTDLKSEVIAGRAKGIRHSFLDKFYYGDAGVNAKEFSGLHTILLETEMNGQELHEGTGGTGGSLNVANLDAVIDLIRDGTADCLIMTRQVRRRLTQFLRTQSSVATGRDEWGMWYAKHLDIPIYIDDKMVQTETIASGAFSAKTGGLTSSVFAVRFGTDDLVGLQNGGLQTVNLGQLETKDAERTRIRWYCSIALMRTISLALVDGITDVAVEA